jgi:putative glycerol-1-phosphate prenyltransferase
MLLKQITKKKLQSRKSLAILIDPDKITDLDGLLDMAMEAARLGVDYFFVGGSLISNDVLSPVIRSLKPMDVPVIIFPGHYTHVVPEADAILLLSLISGRNADYLIGQHVQAAMSLKKSGIEVIATSYMLVGSASDSSVAYVSNTQPIPFEKTDIAVSTAMAGEMLGHKLVFLDAGSGAKHSVTGDMIAAITREVSCPIVVGGGIRSAREMIEKFNAGADVVVVGNALEEDTSLLEDLCRELNALNSRLDVHQ